MLLFGAVAARRPACSSSRSRRARPGSRSGCRCSWPTRSSARPRTAASSRWCMRFILLPLTLFCGTFFPLADAADLAAVDRLDLAALARHRAGARRLATAPPSRSGSIVVHLAFLVGCSSVGRLAWRDRIATRRFGQDDRRRRRGPDAGGATGQRPLRSAPATPRAVVLRGVIATKSTNWIVVLTGFVEPIFYLLALGVGLGTFIGTVDRLERQRDPVRGVHRAGAARRRPR